MTQIHLRTRLLASSAALLAAGSPVVALAEEEQNTGLQLLLPNMAEFVPACIAFIIIFVIMAKIAWPSILKMMEDRENKIQGDLDAAEEAKAKAEAEAEAYEQKLADVQRQAEEILAQAKREAEEERSRILSKAQKDAVATMTKARGIVDSERKKAMVELSGSVVDLSVEIASKLVGNDLTDEEHCRLAERYLAEVGSANGDE